MSEARDPRDPRRAFWVVDDFEAELAHYTGAPYAVAVDACTNALHLALLRERLRMRANDYPRLVMPRRTYAGVMQAALNAGWSIDWTDEPWSGSYKLEPTRVVDSARDLHRSMYWPGTLTCLSFHAAKQLPLGRGGAILLDDAGDAEWLRRARMDGRRQGQVGPPQAPGFHCYMPPPDAARGLWLLSYLVDRPAELGTDDYPDLSAIA